MTASRNYYAFDIAPTFWERLAQLASDGGILSIDRVLNALNRGNDELKEWANKAFINSFASTDEPNVIQSFGQMMQWVEGQDFTVAAKAEFADAKNADGWLVAYAKANGLVVVTNETLEKERINKVKIPNVFQAFNVPYIHTFQMLRALGIKL